MIFNPHALTNGEAANVFFEMANSDRVQYKCRQGAIVDVKQARNIKNSTGGIVWETAFMLAAFLEVKQEATL